MALEKLINKAPLIDDGPPKHSKRGGGAKPFCIERRFIGGLPEDGFVRHIYESQQEWHTYRRYETKDALDKAIASMHKRRVHGWLKYEYRVQNILVKATHEAK